MMRAVMGPGFPLPIDRPSAFTTGTISAAVPVRKHSSATKTSWRVMSVSRALTPSSAAISNTTERVIPRSAPDTTGGVKIWPCLTMKTLSAVHSATFPASFNMSASSAPARFASIRAIKSLNYLNNVMARIEANLAGADEALMLNDAGNVAECTADNVFIIKHGQIFTPPITAGALRGITRSIVFDIAGEFDLKVKEADFTRHDVFIADECFLTGTAAE